MFLWSTVRTGRTMACPVLLSKSPAVQQFTDWGIRKLHTHILSRSFVSESLQAHALQTARLLSPWDYPSKSTGVGCHFLLQGNPPDPEIKPEAPALAGGSFTTETPGTPRIEDHSSVNQTGPARRDPRLLHCNPMPGRQRRRNP